MAVTCAHCGNEIREAPLLVPRMPTGVSRYHPGKTDCRVRATLTAKHTWPARLRARKIREATHGSPDPVS